MSSLNQNLPKIVTTTPGTPEKLTAVPAPRSARRAPRKNPQSQQNAIYSTTHIAIHIVIGAVSYLAILAYVWSTRENPHSIFKYPDFEENSKNSSKTSEIYTRLTYTLYLQVYPVEVLQFLILAVIYCRLGNFTARNPLAGNEHFVEKANLILRNTVEQMLYFELTIFIFAVTVNRKYLFLVPFSTAVFVLGRVVFAVGYYFHPKYRVVGFVWTMLPVFLLQGVNFCAFHGVDLFKMLDQWLF